jgi:molybdate transport system ATP-binding protein
VRVSERFAVIEEKINSMIKFSFKSRRDVYTIDASGSFPKTGITVLFGRSGCGKTSLLRFLMGLEGHSTGTFKIAERVVQDYNVYTQTWGRNLGYVDQQAALFTHQTVLENLQFAEKRCKKLTHQWTRDDLIKRFKLSELLSQYPSQLSGGQQQKVAIARALLSQPDCLLLDEPVSALDEEARFEVLESLESLLSDKQLSILYVSHDRREVAQLADYILIMQDGKITHQGAYKNIATDLNLPFAHGRDALSILPVIINEESTDHLTALCYEEQTLWIRASGLKEGDEIRLQISANEVSISLERQLNTSVLNQLPVTVIELGNENSGQQLVSMSTGSHQLLARITSRSVGRLKLIVGTKCFANFKAVALHL